MTTSDITTTTTTKKLIFDAVETKISSATDVPLPWLYDTTMSFSIRGKSTPQLWWRLVDLGYRRHIRVKRIARAFAHAGGGAWFVARESPQEGEEWWGIATAPWEAVWKIGLRLRLNRSTIACPQGGWASGSGFSELRQRLEWLLPWTYRLDASLLAVRTISSGCFVQPWVEHVTTMGHLISKGPTCLMCEKLISRNDSAAPGCRGHAEKPLWSFIK